MQSLSKVLMQDEGPSIASAAKCPIVAPSAVGHQHCRQVNPHIGQLHLHRSGSQILHKMVEVKPLTNVSSASIKKFFWQNIMCRYGVPRHITIDNVKYFDNAMFMDFYHQIWTKVAFASVYQWPNIWSNQKKSLKVKRKENGWRSCPKQYGATTLQCVEQQTSCHSG